jgi:hypothetical protein
LDKISNRNEPNNDKSNNNEISPRGFLELGSAAVTGVAGVLAMTGIASAQQLVPGVKTGKGSYITDPGPTECSWMRLTLTLAPPTTDGRTLCSNPAQD